MNMLEVTVRAEVEADVEVDLAAEISAMGDKQFEELWNFMLREKADRTGLSGLDVADFGRIHAALRYLRAAKAGDALHELESAFAPQRDAASTEAKYRKWLRDRDAERKARGMEREPRANVLSAGGANERLGEAQSEDHLVCM